MIDRKTITRIIILVLILIVPGFLYYLLQAKGKNRYKPLPVYGPKEVAKTYHKVRGKLVYDTVYHQIPDYNLYDQNGTKISLNNFKDQIVVYSFFYINCPTLCTQINKNIDSLTANFKQNNVLKFVSITVDPETDDAARLKKYAQNFHADERQWHFLTGDTSTIYPLGRKGFLVNTNEINAQPKQFIYSEKLILVDPQHRIRGYYNGVLVSDIERLNDEIKVLIAEKLRNVKSNLY